MSSFEANIPLEFTIDPITNAPPGLSNPPPGLSAPPPGLMTPPRSSSSTFGTPVYTPPWKTSNKSRQNEFIKTDRGRLMIFIDGSNLFYTAQMMGIEMDYLKLVEYIVGKDKLVRVYFYAGIDTENIPSLGWQFFMKRSGFRMVTKPLVTFADGVRKANCDVEMAVDMVSLCNKNAFDTAILVSGDGDLTRALTYIADQGKQVELIGNKINTNENLIQAADRFVDLESIRSLITKNLRNNNGNSDNAMNLQ